MSGEYQEPIRDTFIISKKELLFDFIKPLKDKGRTKDKVMKTLVPNIRGGSYQTAKKDAIILKLVKNGIGLEITELGNDYLNKCDERAFLKDLLLNVKLFKEMYESNLRDRNKIEEFVYNKIKGHYAESLTKTLTKAISLRYLEYIWNIYKRRRPLRNIDFHVTVPTPKSLKQQLLSLGVEPKEIFRMIKSLPDDKQEKVFEAIFK